MHPMLHQLRAFFARRCQLRAFLVFLALASFTLKSPRPPVEGLAAFPQAARLHCEVGGFWNMCLVCIWYTVYLWDVRPPRLPTSHRPWKPPLARQIRLSKRNLAASRIISELTSLSRWVLGRCAKATFSRSQRRSIWVYLDQAFRILGVGFWGGRLVSIHQGVFGQLYQTLAAEAFMPPPSGPPPKPPPAVRSISAPCRRYRRVV